MHRQENVDNLKILKKLTDTLNKLVKKFNKKIVWPIHPRSKKMLKLGRVNLDRRILLIKPLGFLIL